MKRSGSESFWPALVQTNEILMPLRFKYIMLAGVMMTDKEPKSDLLNSILSKFMKLVGVHIAEGIELKAGDIRITFTIKLLFAVVDTVARPILKCRVQYNGFYGCSWCYQKGFYSNCVRYPFDPDFVLRTHELHLQDVHNVQLRDQNLRKIRYIRQSFVNGVKGHSCLFNLNQVFDMVWSFPLEYLHCIPIGVLEQLWEIWVKKAHYLHEISKILMDF